MKKILSKQHYKLIFSIIYFFLLTLSGCSLQQDNDSIKHLPIAEVRKQVEADMEELKNGSYENLSCEEFTPFFPESNEWYNLHITSKGADSSKKGAELAQLMQENYDKARKIIGKEMSEQCIRFIFNNFEEQIEYKDTLWEQAEGGAYDNMEYNGIMYDAAEKEDAECFYLWMNWLQEEFYYIANESAEDTEEVEESEETGQTEKTYYYTCSEEEKKQAYTLCDGNSVSIGEAMEMAEEYINQNFGTFPMKVKRLDVIKFKGNRYKYNVQYVKCHNDIGFDNGKTMSRETEEAQKTREISYENKSLDIIGKDRTGTYTNYVQSRKIEDTGESITSCITLKQALETISENVGLTSSYLVKNAEISYRSVAVEKDHSECAAYPVWEIETVNQSDDKETRFYVNVADGTLEVDIFE